MIGYRQSADIIIRKLDPWPRTHKSPSYLKTRGNLQFFLENLRAEVNIENVQNDFPFSLFQCVSQMLKDGNNVFVFAQLFFLLKDLLVLINVKSDISGKKRDYLSRLQCSSLSLYLPMLKLKHN